jgi:hypothetical protein
MSFANLKRNRTDFSKLVSAAQQAGGGEQKSYGDDRMWKPKVDKAGNGYAIMRFLPAKEGADIPWARYWDHGFKGPTGQWYIEKSLTSIGKEDPVGELNSKLWNSGYEDDKETARKQKRRLHYVANVLIVSDPGNPENEGKVMLFQFGKKIFDKIMDVMQPQFPDEKPVNPFDFWEGADFVLKIRQVEGYRNYDKSEFRTPSSLYDGNEEKLEKVYNQLHDLSEFTDPKNYKSYDELKTKLYQVLGESSPRTVKQEVALDDEVPYDTLGKSSAAEEPRSATPVRMATAESSMDEDEDDTMSYFAKLAAED